MELSNNEQRAVLCLRVDPWNGRTVENEYRNDDAGQMSAWYVLSAMGFYPMNPMNGTFVFGSPLMDQAVIRLAGNKQFRIVVKDNSKENKYIQKVVLNGVVYNKSYFLYKDVMKGGKMEIYMGSKPSATFGVKQADRPIW